MRELVLTALEGSELSVPTTDPFVIASGEVRATRSVLVRARLHGSEATGLGEASCLPPVTREDQPDALAAGPRYRLPAEPGLAISTRSP